MKNSTLIILLLILIFTAAACTAKPYPSEVATLPPFGEGAQSPELPTTVEFTPLAPAVTVTVTPVSSSEPPKTPGGGMLPAVEKVIQLYASQNNLALSAIKLVSTELVDWPDGCLGVVLPGMACIEVITPGYRILLDVNGTSVELHSTISGDFFVVALPGGKGRFPVK